MENEKIKEKVKRAYSERAERVASSCCPSCGPIPCSLVGYSLKEIKGLPPVVLSLFGGCGNPIAFADINEGETVLDLGSGAGMDVFLAAKRVGENGRVIGVDFSEKLIEVARWSAERTGFQNVEFRSGDLENLPMKDESVDVIISNCVINLIPNKEKVFREAYRALKPGGRMIISDMVTDEELPKSVREDPNLWCNCIGGATPEREYVEAIEKAGFKDVSIVERGISPQGETYGICETEVQGVRVYHIIVKANKQ